MGFLSNDFAPQSLIRSRAAFQPYKVMTPISNVAGIAPAVAMAAVGTEQQLTLTAAGAANSYFFAPNHLLIPCVPVFYDSVNTNRYAFRMSGLDQFGDPITSVGFTKLTTALQTRYDLPAFSRIDSIFVTPTVLATPGVDTISVGWSPPTGSQQARIPAPFKVVRDGEWGTFVYVRSLGGAIGPGAPNTIAADTFEPISAATGQYSAESAAILTSNTSVQKSVISFRWDIAAGTPNTAPMEFWFGLLTSNIKDLH